MLGLRTWESAFDHRGDNALVWFRPSQQPLWLPLRGRPRRWLGLGQLLLQQDLRHQRDNRVLTVIWRHLARLVRQIPHSSCHGNCKYHDWSHLKLVLPWRQDSCVLRRLIRTKSSYQIWNIRGSPPGQQRLPRRQAIHLRELSDAKLVAVSEGALGSARQKQWIPKNRLPLQLLKPRVRLSPRRKSAFVQDTLVHVYCAWQFRLTRFSVH